MVKYSKLSVKLSDPLNLKSAAENQKGVILRINIKMFHGNDLSYELLLTTTHKT